jgi:hypothetical protein
LQREFAHFVRISAALTIDITSADWRRPAA